MTIAIDAADRAILRAFQDDSATPIQALADAAGLSVPSVQRRLRRLRQEGVVTGETGMVDPAKLGLQMTFIVMVEMERERLDQLEAFKRRARREPHVQQCYYITGDADFVLVCLTRDMAEFEALTQRLFYADDNVRRFRTSVVLNRTKIGLALPID